MSLRIRQIVFAARDLDKTVAQFERALQIEIAYRDPQVGEFGLRNALLPIGDQFLEVVSPTRPDTAGGRHIERNGDSSYMLIFQSDDFARDRARIDRLGVRLVWHSKYPDIEAMHLHPKDIGAAIVSIDQPVPPESWRWAGPDWKKHVSKSGAQNVVEATIGAVDPESLAKRWSEVLGIDAPAPTGNGYRIGIASGALNFVPHDRDLIVEYAISAAHVTKSDTVTICGTRLRLSPATR